jgi:hypothetical protein
MARTQSDARGSPSVISLGHGGTGGVGLGGCGGCSLLVVAVPNIAILSVPFRFTTLVFYVRYPLVLHRVLDRKAKSPV